MKCLLIPLALALLLSACSQGALDGPAEQSSGPVAGTGDAALMRDAGAPFQTDRLSYTLVTTPAGIEGQIAYVLTNHTGGPIFIVNCNGATSLNLEKQVGDRWVRAWGPVIPTCLSAPIVVEPEQEYRDVVHVFGGHPASNMDPKFTVDLVPGVYRLVWHDVLRTYDHNAFPHHGEALPMEQRISNHFRLDVE